MKELVAGVLVLATFAMIAGGAYLITKGHDRKRGMLMLVLAVVMFVNVLIMTF